MAFVFRSQKQSPFNPLKPSYEHPKSSSIGNEQSQLNGTIYTDMPSNQASNSPSKIFKGLPFLLKKNHSIQSDDLKENQFFPEPKLQNVKANLKQFKKVTSNYFFTSNVPRNINNQSPKILDKSLTCSQFNASTNDQPSILDQKKLLTANNFIKNLTINRNILLAEEKNTKDLRKPQTEPIQRTKQIDQLLINCSKQQNPSIKRKSSPPHGFQKTCYSTALQRLKFQKDKKQETDLEDKGELYMKTIEDAKLLKRSHTQKKLSKLHKGNIQSSFYKDSDSENSDSYDENDNDTPGPGSYENTVNLKQMKSFRSKKEKFTKIFVSPLERFKAEQVKYHEVTYINEQNPPKQQRPRKNQVFLSNTPKFIPIEKKSPSPEPGTYNPRQSLEHDIVRNLLRNANIASFNSTLPRFKEEKSHLTPGPGQYNVDSLEAAKLQQIRNNLSSCYKSQVPRCLDYVREEPLKDKKEQTCSIRGLMDKKHKDYVIHKREQHFDSSEFFSPPGFFSGVERFKEMSKESAQLAISQGLPVKNWSKEAKNTQAFNSSQERKLSQPVGEGVGVGSYLVNKDRWNKKSYNVFFH